MTAPDRLGHPLVPAAGPLRPLVLLVFWVPPTFSPTLGKPRPALLCSRVVGGGVLLVTFLRQLLPLPGSLSAPVQFVPLVPRVGLSRSWLQGDGEGSKPLVPLLCQKKVFPHQGHEMTGHPNPIQPSPCDTVSYPGHT